MVAPARFRVEPACEMRRLPGAFSERGFSAPKPVTGRGVSGA